MAATAEWVGVIVVGPFELDCRLFSSSRRARPLPLRNVHTNCHTVLEEEIGGKEVEESVAASEEKTGKPVTQVREQFFCLKCQRPVKSDEVGKGVETESGVIEISEAEIASLEFEPAKRVKAELIRADDPAIEAVGFGRRFYVLPKPAGLEAYAHIFYTLRESGRVAFISPLVIKRKPYVAVLQPLEIPAVIFGGARWLLVINVLNDTDQLRDPAELPDYPGALAEPPFAKLAQPIAEAQKVISWLDPERCVNPGRQRLKGIIKRAVARSLR
jgi:non-homologous end joining protein Ku